MEKNEFNELLDGIVECADKVAKLGRLLKEVLPQLAEQTTEAPTDVPAVEATPIFNSGILFIFLPDLSHILFFISDCYIFAFQSTNCPLNPCFGMSNQPFVFCSHPFVFSFFT